MDFSQETRPFSLSQVDDFISQIDRIMSQELFLESPQSAPLDPAPESGVCAAFEAPAAPEKEALLDWSGQNLELIGESKASLGDFVPSSKIKRLMLKNNRLRSVAGLARLRALESLDCSFNALEALSVGQKLHQLTALDLSWNRVAALKGLCLSFLPRLESLNLSGNAISSLAGLPKLAFLKVLRLRQNHLEEVDASLLAQKLPSLEFLDVSENRVRRFRASTVLRPRLPRLVEVAVRGNRLRDLGFLEFFPRVFIADASANQIGTCCARGFAPRRAFPSLARLGLLS